MPAPPRSGKSPVNPLKSPVKPPVDLKVRGIHFTPIFIVSYYSFITISPVSPVEYRSVSVETYSTYRSGYVAATA